MDVATQPAMTLDEFLAWEERQETRFEFNGREPEEMTGGTDRHSLIKVSLLSHVFPQLQESTWLLFNSDMKLEVAGSIRCPHCFVGPHRIDDWVGHLLVGRAPILAMPEIGVTLTPGKIHGNILPPE